MHISRFINISRSCTSQDILFAYMPPQTAITNEELNELMECRSNRDPVPILIHKAENKVIRELRDIAIKGCDEHVKVLAKCAEGKLISVVWHCRVHSKAVDACMRSYANDKALKDELRRRYVIRTQARSKALMQLACN